MPEQNINDRQVLLAFVDRMVLEKNPKINNDARQKVRIVLMERLEKRVEHAMVMALPDDKLLELESLLEEKAGDEAIDQIFETSGADFEAAVKAEMEKFRQEYLESGDNDELIESFDRKWVEFLETAQPGQGYPDYAMPTPEQLAEVAEENKKLQMAMAGGAQ